MIISSINIHEINQLYMDDQIYINTNFFPVSSRIPAEPDA